MKERVDAPRKPNSKDQNKAMAAEYERCSQLVANDDMKSNNDLSSTELSYLLFQNDDS